MTYYPDSRTTSGQTFWVTRHATTILFFMIVFSAAGLYLAGRDPHLGLSGN